MTTNFDTGLVDFLNFTENKENQSMTAENVTRLTIFDQATLENSTQTPKFRKINRIPVVPENLPGEFISVKMTKFR